MLRVFKSTPKEAEGVSLSHAGHLHFIIKSLFIAANENVKITYRNDITNEKIVINENSL